MKRALIVAAMVAMVVGPATDADENVMERHDREQELFGRIAASMIAEELTSWRIEGGLKACGELTDSRPPRDESNKRILELYGTELIDPLQELRAMSIYWVFRSAFVIDYQEALRIVFRGGFDRNVFCGAVLEAAERQ